MRITISTHARRRGFYLAKYLVKSGILTNLITAYPKYKCKELVPELIEQTVSISSGFLLQKLLEKVKPSYVNMLQYFFHEWYDKKVASLYDGSDLIHGWSSFFLHTLRKAKKLGAITIVDRASAHIIYQQYILKEEYSKYGIDFKGAHAMIIQKELQEYEEADYISIPSKFVKKTFLEKGFSEDKLICQPYGVNLSEFGPVFKEDKTFRIIHCGGITLQKGVHYLLQAFNELKLPNGELWLIGDMSEEIKPFLKRYDNGKVLIKGPYRQNELYRYYSQGSVFCLMSIQEGLAMVIPQAMACGLPVICTNATGGEEIVRDGIDGFIIPIRDVETLKEKIVYLYENPNIRKAMGKSAKERVSQGFTWDDYGRRMIKEYERIYKVRK